MKKVFILLTAMVLMGCSSDDDNSGTNSSTFNLDGTVYTLQVGMDIMEIRMPEAIDYNGETYDRSTISFVGMDGTTSSGTITFDLYYKTGTSIDGTYNIYDSVDDEGQDFEVFIDGENRACMGWTSAAAVFMLDGSDLTTANNPTGTVQVIVNSATNYTVKFNGNFRLYDTDFNFIENMPANIDISSNVTIQN